MNLKKLPVEISETDQFRTLHLETDSIQSSMDISDPVHLALKYTQVTALLLLFKRHPKNILKNIQTNYHVKIKQNSSKPLEDLLKAINKGNIIKDLK